MDMLKTVREIGFFESALNMSSSTNNETVRMKVEEAMPMPGATFAPNIEASARWLTNFDKHKLMFLSPEIALLEEIGNKRPGSFEAILAVPCDMDPESKERLKNNLPRGMSVQILEEPYFAEAFLPSNGIIIACGYMGGDRLMVLPETYRMIEHYNSFFGKKVFIPYVMRKDAKRFHSWMEVSSSKFNEVWRNEL